jgi:hypothetical protein
MEREDWMAGKDQMIIGCPWSNLVLAHPTAQFIFIFLMTISSASGMPKTKLHLVLPSSSFRVLDRQIGLSCRPRSASVISRAIHLRSRPATRPSEPPNTPKPRPGDRSAVRSFNTGLRRFAHRPGWRALRARHAP